MSASTRVKTCAPFSEGTEHVVHSVPNAYSALVPGELRGFAASAAPGMPPAGEARGDAAAGQAAVLVCSACHGQEGKAILPTHPNLGGQHYSYLLRQMRAFKGGDRYAQLTMGQWITSRMKR